MPTNVGIFYGKPFAAGTVFQLIDLIRKGKVTEVAIPLEQGRFFNTSSLQQTATPAGRNPFGAGTVFQSNNDGAKMNLNLSQSLWSRDGFSIRCTHRTARRMQVAIPLEQGRFFNREKIAAEERAKVAIPLEQGRFFNKTSTPSSTAAKCRNPFGAGTVFQCYVDLTEVMSAVSQSLWSRDGFSISAILLKKTSICRNPFGAGTVFQ